MLTKALAKHYQTNAPQGARNLTKPGKVWGGNRRHEHNRTPIELMKDYPKQPKTPQKGFSYPLQQQKAWRGWDSPDSREPKG